jgi:acyl carrier protein
MSNEAIAEKVRAFLAPHLHGHTLRDDEDIFALGFVNSLFALQLVMFIEKEFAIVMEPADLEFDNFRTVAALVALVGAKTATVAS